MILLIAYFITPNFDMLNEVQATVFIIWRTSLINMSSFLTIIIHINTHPIETLT
jgi:hypothetical protein